LYQIVLVNLLGGSLPVSLSGNGDAPLTMLLYVVLGNTVIKVDG